MPLQELFKYIIPPPEIKISLSKMLHNSIYIIIVQVRKDNIGDHFSLYIPDKSIIFHRLSKLNFLGDAYRLPGAASTLMAEVTFRPGSHLSTLSESAVLGRTIGDLARLGFIDPRDVIDTAVRMEPYAYVVYNLAHRHNVDAVLVHLRGMGIDSVGRFAEFEYLNSDAVVERTLKFARALNAGLGAV